MRLREGEVGAVIRFGMIGIVATFSFLFASLAFLNAGLNPQIANLVALIIGTATSYCGHYFFTYRSTDRHARLGSRFLAVTGLIWILCSLLHHVALAWGLAPPRAAILITFAYPPLSFLLNHFWAFSRGRHTNAKMEP